MSIQYLWNNVPIYSKNLISSGIVSTALNDRLSQTAIHAYDTYCSMKKGDGPMLPRNCSSTTSSTIQKNSTERTGSRPKRKRHLSLVMSNQKSANVTTSLSPTTLTTNDYFFEHQRVNGFIHGTRILSKNEDICKLKDILSLQLEPYLEFWGAQGNELLSLMKHEILSLDLWAAIQRGQGAHHKNHVHENVFLSGVYYCKVPQGSAPLIFYKPECVGKQGEELVTEESHFFDPEEGRIVLFPPWLLHGVPPVATNDITRISFAFNLSGPYRNGNPWSVTMPI